MREKKFPIDVIVAIVLILVILGMVIIVSVRERENRIEVSGTYSNIFQVNGSSDNSVTVYYRFNADKGTYSEIWGDSVLMTGKYTVDGNTVTVITDGNPDSGAESETLKFYVDEKALIPADYIYQGELPEGQTFDATVSMTDRAGFKYEVSFSKDGSYQYSAETTSGTTKMKYTYNREGRNIHRFNEKGEQLTDFYIYQDQLAGIYYEKEEE